MPLDKNNGALWTLGAAAALAAAGVAGRNLRGSRSVGSMGEGTIVKGRRIYRASPAPRSDLPRLSLVPASLSIVWVPYSDSDSNFLDWNDRDTGIFAKKGNSDLVDGESNQHEPLFLSEHVAIDEGVGSGGDGDELFVYETTRPLRMAVFSLNYVDPVWLRDNTDFFAGVPDAVIERDIRDRTGSFNDAAIAAAMKAAGFDGWIVTLDWAVPPSGEDVMSWSKIAKNMRDRQGVPVDTSRGSHFWRLYLVDYKRSLALVKRELLD